MATGLANLAQAVTDLKASVDAAVAKLAALSAQLTALNSEDPQVVALAASIETEVGNLNAAVNPPAPPAPTA